MNHTLTDSLLTTMSLAPASRTGTAAGSAATGATYVDCSDFMSVRVLFEIGAISSSGSVSVQVFQASDSSGTGAAAITSGSVAPFGTAGQNLPYSVTINVDQLGTKPFLAGRITTYVNGETSVASCVIERYKPRHMPVSVTGLGADVRLVA